MGEYSKQVLASVVAFAAGYAVCMAANHAMGYFEWPCVAAGFTVLTGYHGGLWQNPPAQPK